MKNRDKYPTKEQILEKLFIPNEELQTSIQQWKEKYFIKKWKKEKHKHKRLIQLIEKICSTMNVNPPRCTIIFYEWAYMPKANTIIMDIGRPSIISALHELGHHLHEHKKLPEKPKETELAACRFSVGIFKTMFNKSYENLIWEGHTLVAKKETNEEKQKEKHRK